MTPPSRTALLIVDMQRDFVLPGGPCHVAGAQATVPALRRLLDHARAAGWLVTHVVRRHRPDGGDAEITRRHLFAGGRGVCVAGSEGAAIIPELTPLPGELVQPKTRCSAFFGTPLADILRRHDVGRAVVAGTQWPNCVRATAVDAMSHDFLTILAVDACSAQDAAIAQANRRDLEALGIPCLEVDRLIASPPF